MSINSADILKKLSVQEIQHLQNLYKQHSEKLPHIYSFLGTAIEWSNKETAEQKLVEVFAPQDDSWKTNGTFIAVLLAQLPKTLIVLHTLEQDCKNLKECLSDTNRIDLVVKPVFLFALYDHLKDVVEEVLVKNKGLVNRESGLTQIWRMKRDIALKQDDKCPDGFYFDELKVEHAPIVNQFWPQKQPGTELFVKLTIELGRGYGVFSKSNGELVSWVLTTVIGQLGLLQTKDGFGRKGLATCVTHKLAKHIASKGYDPIGTIFVDNEPSKKLFAKMGYEMIGMCYFLSYSK